MMQLQRPSVLSVASMRVESDTKPSAQLGAGGRPNELGWPLLVPNANIEADPTKLLFGNRRLGCATRNTREAPTGERTSQRHGPLFATEPSRPQPFW